MNIWEKNRVLIIKNENKQRNQLHFHLTSRPSVHLNETNRRGGHFCFRHITMNLKSAIIFLYAQHDNNRTLITMQSYLFEDHCSGVKSITPSERKYQGNL